MKELWNLNEMIDCPSNMKESINISAIIH